MTPELWIGLALALAAGLMSGNCMLPSKFVKRWAWENTWLVFTLLSLVVFPWLLAFTMVQDVFAVYGSLPASAFVAPLGYGFGWGIAQVLFGLSIARLGMALGYAVIVGLGALLGTMVPLVTQNRDVLGTGRGTLILCGVAIMVVGICVSGYAGRLRESAGGKVRSPTGSGSYASALLLAVICGFMAPMLNYSFAFGQGIAQEAVRQGSTPASAAYAVWPVGLSGGLIPNLAYSIYLLNRNRTWGRFRPFLPEVAFGSTMAVLWMGAMSVYGVSAVYLGALGTSVGWALFQIFMIMTANVSGVVTGEWKGASRSALTTLWAGLLLLAVATVVISLGNR